MANDFRNLARAHLKNAKDLLATGDDDDCELATLKLRKAMEALTYERSEGYADDLGPEKMKTWQPKKLMERMLEVDPHADKDATIAFGIEPSYGEKPEVMQSMGTDYVLDMKTLKKHYDALGAYLHTPTLAQLEQGKSHDFNKLRKRCDEIVAAVDKVLSSRIWNSTMANRGEIECNECDTIIRRRLDKNGEEKVVECWDCVATYNMKDLGDGEVRFEPRQIEVPCPNKECETSIHIWEKEFKKGTWWTCRVCETQQQLSLFVHPKDQAENKE